MTSDTQVVQLLWTGGWDSTFRLLQLLLGLHVAVQPHYLIDSERRSTGEELYAMDRIKREIFASYPFACDQLRPTIFCDIVDLPDIPAISKCYERLRARLHLGTQYEWLAKYCAHTNLKDVEMAITVDGLAKKLRSLVASSQEGNHRVYWVDEVYRASDEYIVFQPYRFPLFDLGKRGMQTIANQEGWLDIMELTWFCHRPRSAHTPCGICNPCADAMEWGMSWRLPAMSRAMYYLSLRPLVRRNPGFHGASQRIRRFLVGDRVRQAS